MDVLSIKYIFMNYKYFLNNKIWLNASAYWLNTNVFLLKRNTWYNKIFDFGNIWVTIVLIFTYLFHKLFAILNVSVFFFWKK